MLPPPRSVDEAARPVTTYRYRTHHRRRYRRRMFGREGAALAVLGGVVLAAAVHASGGTPAIPNPAASGCATSSVACGQQMTAARGWTGAEWTCLDRLWTRESGWSAYAANPYSDARGIPQNINGWSAYAPGDAASQIRWGLGYVAGRYGDPCTAWQHETQDGWY